MADGWKLVRCSWLFDPEPMDIVHMEAQETDYGYRGFHHERDAYLGIRSDAIVALVVTIDGVAQPAYAIPSTAGARSLLYLPFAANKGKLYRYTLDSAGAFHLYDLSVRAKGWEEASYKIVQPNFGLESPVYSDTVQVATKKENRF